MQENYFFELIRVAVGSAEALSQAPTPEEWGKIYEEAQRQTLVGVLYDALNRLPAEQQPPKMVLVNWHAASEKIRYDNEKANRDAVWVSKKFAQVGFRNVVLKGQGNALLYPDPLLRNSGDVDIWLEGSRKKIIDYVRRFFPQERVQWLEINFPIKKDTVIEVHTAPSVLFDPFDNRRLQRFYDKHREKVFANEVTLPNGGVIHVPTVEVNLVFQLTHIYRHLFYEGIGLRQVMDYLFLLQQKEVDESTRSQVNKHIRSLHMSRFCSALMWVIREVFCGKSDSAGLDWKEEYPWMLMEPDEREGRFLLREIMLAGNFGHYDERNNTKSDKWGNFWQITGRNWRFLTRYPREVLWNPWYRISQFLWRIKNGYR